MRFLILIHVCFLRLTKLIWIWKLGSLHWVPLWFGQVTWERLMKLQSKQITMFWLIFPLPFYFGRISQTFQVLHGYFKLWLTHGRLGFFPWSGGEWVLIFAELYTIKTIMCMWTVVRVFISLVKCDPAHAYLYHQPNSGCRQLLLQAKRMPGQSGKWQTMLEGWGPVLYDKGTLKFMNWQMLVRTYLLVGRYSDKIVKNQNPKSKISIFAYTFSLAFPFIWSGPVHFKAY